MSKPRRPAHGPAKVEHHEPRSPGAGGGDWIWGTHAVLSALQNPERKLLRVVATPAAKPALEALPDIPAIQTLEKDELQKLLPAGAVHQGLAVLARPLRPTLIEDLLERAETLQNSVVVALDQASDPHNVGAVLRSAAAFGALALILPDRNAPEATGVLAKAASGALEHVPIVRVVNLARALAQLKQARFWVVGLEGEAERTLASHPLGGKLVLVLGSEGEGLRRLTRESCDLLARLPTTGPISSLNLSNAAAVALYEVVRQSAGG